MSAIVSHLPTPIRGLLILALIVLGSASSPLHAARGSCTSAVPLSPGETWRDPGREAGDGVCFELGLEAAGLLMLDVSTSAAAARARLVLVGHEPRTAVLARLQESAAGLVLAAAPGDYRLRVEAEDPRQRLPPFVLRARFAGLAKGETDSETEVDPDPFAAPCWAKGETDSETEVDPDPFATPCWAKGETDSETEVDPDPFTGPSRHDLSAAFGPLRPAFTELCGQGETDDHGDVFACASALAPGGQAGGELGNAWGDDGDVFRFRVRRLGAVEVQARGAAPGLELAAELYDRHGQRLAVAGDAGEGPRLVRTLIPGTYFVRLESGDGAPGRYTLSVGSPAP